MQLQNWIGVGAFIVVLALVAWHYRDRPRELCSFCGLSFCDGEDCVQRIAWEGREAAALARLDAALNEETDDLHPWRDYLKSL
jgi:hypothetical protein